MQINRLFRCAPFSDQVRYQVDIFSTTRREDGPLGRAARTCEAEPPAIAFAGGAADKHPLSALMDLRQAVERKNLYELSISRSTSCIKYYHPEKQP